jgi:hypothetical protein
MKTKLLGWRKPAMTGGGLKLLIVPVLTILLVSGNGDAQTNYVELKAFDAANVLGDTPYGLIEGSDGGLYGTAAYGGASTQGTVLISSAARRYRCILSGRWPQTAKPL